jgi:hypothetical protein
VVFGALVVVVAILVVAFLSVQKGDDPRGQEALNSGATFESAEDLLVALDGGGLGCEGEKTRIRYDESAGVETAECHRHDGLFADIYVFDSSTARDEFLDGLPATAEGSPAIDAVVGQNWVVSADEEVLRALHDVLGGAIHNPA